MDHDDGGLLSDQRGKGLRTGVGVPVGVTHHHFHARGFEFFFQALVPANGQVKAIGHGNKGHRFTGERFFVALAKRLVQALALRKGWQRDGCAQGQAGDGLNQIFKHVFCLMHRCLLG